VTVDKGFLRIDRKLSEWEQMSMDAKRIGRPPKDATPGVRVSLGLKVTPETKALLDGRARANSRTQSQEAEAWIEQAKALNDLGDAGAGVSEAITAMVREALKIHQQTGGVTRSVAARDELRRRWTEIAATALPNVSETAAVSAAKAAISAMRYAAIDLYAELERASGTEVAAGLKEYVLQINLAQLYPGSARWPQAKALFEQVASDERGPIGDCVKVLLGQAAAAELAERRSRQESAS
jgi:hypothetical protein